MTRLLSVLIIVLGTHSAPAPYVVPVYCPVWLCHSEAPYA